MRIGILTLSLAVPEAHSLKDKRRVIKSIMERMRHRFNVSVSEVALHDMPTRAELGVAVIGSDTAFVNSVLDNILKFAGREGRAYITDSNIEMF